MKKLNKAMYEPSASTPEGTSTSNQPYERPAASDHGTIDINAEIANLLSARPNAPFTEDQQSVLRTVLQYFNELGPVRPTRQPPKDSLKLFVHGGPGSGKSTCIEPLETVADKHNIGCIKKVTYMGIAAGLIGGITIKKTFKCDGHKAKVDLDRCEILALAKTLDLNRLALLVVDEVSMITPTILHIVDKRLRQITGNTDVPFGGIGVLLTGDFMQTPPVKAVSFPDATITAAHIKMQGDDSGADDILKAYLKNSKQVHAKRKLALSKCSTDFSPNSGNRQGALLMIQFTAIFLAGNVRVTDTDRAHADYIDFLHRGNKFSANHLLNLYSRLTEEDVTGDPSWKYATIIVPCNRERHDLNLSQLQAFARDRGLPIVRWRKDQKKWEDRPLDCDAQLKAMEDPYFWQYFVPGADAYCTENLCIPIKLANGTPVRLHSLSFTDTAEANYYKSGMEYYNPGDFITLLKPPASVNVVPWPNKPIYHNVYDESTCLFLDPTFIRNQDGNYISSPVIPLPQGTATYKDEENMLIHGGPT
jgi:hypothetical protein